MSFRPIILACAMLVFGTLSAQTTIVGNNGGSATDFVGWDNDPGNNFPLQIRHDAGDQPIEFYTTANMFADMLLTPNLTGFSFNGYPSLDLTRNLGIGPNFSLLNPPLARVHINSDIVAGFTLGYRDWMRTGTLCTEGSDGMYVGMKHEGPGTNANSAVIGWSDDFITPALANPLRFVFTTDPQLSGIFGMGADNDGLEIARLIPATDANEGFFGIGDFFSAVDNPTERLDVLDGDVRIRELPDASNEAVDQYKVMVVDDSSDPDEIGIVKWVDPADLSADCEWTMNATAPNHVYTAVGTAIGDCPDNLEAVAVGLSLASGTPPAKFTTDTRDFARAVQVTNETPTTNVTGIKVNASNGSSNNLGLDVVVNNPNSGIFMNYGARFDLTGPATRTRGVQALTAGGTHICYAGDFQSYDITSGTGSESFGINGYVWAGENLTIGVSGTSRTAARDSYGVRGTSHGSTTNTTARHYGVLGLASVGVDGQVACAIRGEAPTNANNSWAVYSAGRQYSTTSTMWSTISDQTVKVGVEDLVNASDILSQLNPKSYQYNTAEYGFLNLAPGPQMGLLAQEVEAILPDQVSDMHFPAQFDSTGVQISPALDLKAVSYAEFLPMLIAGHKEQQALVDQQAAQLAAQQAQIEALTDQASANQAATDELEELRNRMDQLEQLLAACCQNPADPRSQQIDGTGGTEENDRILRIQPNPFNEQTTIYYQLERSGRMQLMANSSDGKQLRVLEEAQREAGAYQFEWITNDLAPGIYYVTLLLDGEPVVKKAVKVR